MKRGRYHAWGTWTASFGALLLICACGPPTLDTPPASIEGLWTTKDDPRYADRAFEITEDFLYLLQGGDTFAVHTIREVQITEDDLPGFTIEYRGDAGALFLFRVYLSQEDGGTLFLQNRMDMKWRRDPDFRVPWAPARAVERDTAHRAGS